VFLDERFSLCEPRGLPLPPGTTKTAMTALSKHKNKSPFYKNVEGECKNNCNYATHLPPNALNAQVCDATPAAIKNQKSAPKKILLKFVLLTPNA
jgi:hypothetical protein